MEIIELDLKLKKEIEQHAESTYPYECCGFVLGDAQSRTVQEVYLLENAKEGDQRRRFEIDPLDYIKVEQHALQQGTSLLGVYHSHPDHPSVPSEHDLKQAFPNFSYLIVSVEKGRSKRTQSWRLNEENKFKEEIIKTVINN